MADDRVTLKSATLTGIADAIRAKTGSEAAYKPGEMAAAIRGIETGTASGPIDLDNIPEVDSIDDPADTDPTIVRYDGAIYLLCEGELKNG